MRRGVLIGLFIVLPAFGQEPGEKFKIDDLKFRITDLTFKVTDLSGNLVDIGGRVEDIQIKETPTEIRIDLAADVLFDFDKADLLPKAEETLNKAAGFIRERSRGTVRVEGHTDSKGNDNYNLGLSQRRAESVRNWLVQKAGLASVNFATRGFGETQPVVPNERTDGSDDPEGRQKNRRVQIVIQKG